MTTSKNIRVNSPDLPEVPKYLKRIPRRKRFGIEQWSAWNKKWCLRQWYVTAKARDQALYNLENKTTILTGTQWDTPVRKIDR